MTKPKKEPRPRPTTSKEDMDAYHAEAKAMGYAPPSVTAADLARLAKAPLMSGICHACHNPVSAEVCAACGNKQP